jgi:EmrB/QacA subfamily drug resistance transporter
VASLAYSARQPCDEALLRSVHPVAPCPQRDKPWVLAVSILGSSLAFIEGSAVSLALPSLQADLTLSATDLQWAVNVYLLTLGTFMLIGGSLGDRFGLRRVFMLGCAIFGLGALGCAAAPTLAALLCARIVQGVGGALLVPTSLALIGTHFELQERGRAIGTWAGASALTTAVGPLLGGWLVDQWDWRAVFLLVAPLVVLTLAIAAWRVPISPAQKHKRLDYAGALLLAAALGPLTFALVDRDAPLRAVWLLLAAAASIALIWREKHFTAPLLPLGLFASRSFSGTNAMTFLLYAALGGALYFLPFNLIQVQGYSATQAGAAFLPLTLMLGFGSTLAGDLINRYPARKILTIGPLIAGLGFFALAIPGAQASFVTSFLPAVLLVGLGMTISVAPLTTVVMGAVSGRQTGTASGINNTVARLAGAITVALLTAVAIAWFSSVLGNRLEAHGAPAELIERLIRNATQLAELKAPPGTEATLATVIADAVKTAYVSTFRVLVSVCGLLALASAAVAWLTLGEFDAAPRRASAD